MAMLTLREYTYEGLKTKLDPDAKIVIASCDCCARLSDDLGGQVGLNSLADKLEADGYSVVLRCLLKDGCHGTYMESRLEEDAVHNGFENAEVILPLMCLGGERKLAKLIGKEKIFRLTRSIGKGPHDTPDGTRFIRPFDSAPVIIKDKEKGISLPEAAKQLGLESGPY